MLLSRSSGGEKVDSDRVDRDGPGLNLMSSCPHLVVAMGGVPVSCLVDTGSMVSTITESGFREYFEPWDQERLKTCQWLQLGAANGLSIPYIGYIELDVELCGKVVPKCGVLVVRDPPGGIGAQAPGVLGMNVLGRCYQELFGQYGPSLFDSPSVPGASQVVFQALQYCHQASLQSPTEVTGKVKVQSECRCSVPPESLGEQSGGGIDAGNCNARLFAAGLGGQPSSRGTTISDCYCAWLFSGRLRFTAGSGPCYF